MGDTKPGSPIIIFVGWGKMEVEGLGKGKDFKLWPGGGRAWDWQEFGTGHSRGIQVGDCQELVQHGCQTIVLSRGMFKRLKISNQTLDYLAEQGVAVMVDETKKAVDQYNRLARSGEPVGGLFHTTC